MGGWGSGRTGGRPVAEYCSRVDLPWMLRKGLAVPGRNTRGTLRWHRGGEPAGSISYEANMSDLDDAHLILRYTRGSGDDAEKVEQFIRLECTFPNYGGRRWWMICPYRGGRCANLFLPGMGDRFASRTAWRVQYKIQRVEHRDRPFEALFKIQRRLGCQEGWEMPVRRPKGMWHRTYARLENRYWELNDQCTLQMMSVVGIFRNIEAI